MNRKAVVAAALGAGSLLGGVGPAFGQPAAASGQSGIAIIPQPVRLAPGTGSFAITAATKICVGPKNDELRRIGQGLFLGTQTIRQLLPARRTAGAGRPAVEVLDKPRYGWRGRHLDVSRHFFPVGFGKRCIDYLALHKMNTFAKNAQPAAAAPGSPAPDTWLFADELVGQ